VRLDRIHRVPRRNSYEPELATEDVPEPGYDDGDEFEYGVEPILDGLKMF